MPREFKVNAGVGLFLLLVLFLAYAASGMLKSRGFVDSDCYMRLVLVEQLISGGVSWSDHSIPRSNVPYGEVSHWSRVLDGILWACAAFFRPVFGWGKGLYLAAVVVAPLGLLASVGVVTSLGLKLGMRGFLSFALILFSFLQPAVLSYYAFARPDHHFLMLFLMVALLTALVACLREPEGRAWWTVQGILLGLSLWVSVESLVALVWINISLGMAWLWTKDHGHAGKLLHGQAWAAGCAMLVGWASLPLEYGREWWSAEDLDRFSKVHAVLLFLNTGAWVFMLGLWKFRWVDAVWRKSAVLFGCAGFAAAVLWIAFPRFFQGPFADLSPRLWEIWLLRLEEYDPLVPRGGLLPGRLLGWAFGAVAFVILAGVWMKKRVPFRVEYWPFVTGTFLFFTLTWIQIRWAGYLELVCAFPMVLLFKEWSGMPENENELTLGGRVRRVGVLALFLIIPAVAMRFSSEQPARMAVSADSGSLAARAGDEAGLRQASFAELCAFLNGKAFSATGTQHMRILAHVDHGAELLYRTQAGVVATPYHRNEQGILDAYEALHAPDEASALVLFRKRGLTHLLLDGALQEEAYYRRSDGGVSFYGRIQKGELPKWLVEVEMPAALEGRFRLLAFHKPGAG